MARPKSVSKMTPAEIKARKAELTAARKQVADGLKVHTQAKTAAEKALNVAKTSADKTIKAAEKAAAAELKIAEKAHAAVVKAAEKAATAAEIGMAKIDGQLEALSPAD